MTDRRTLRAIIDAHELFKQDSPDGYNVAADHLANALIELFASPAPVVMTHRFRDCDTGRLTRTLDDIKPGEELVAIIPGAYGEWNGKNCTYGPGFRIVFKSAECRHDWESGWGMGAPTRTCKKCGKFERD